MFAHRSYCFVVTPLSLNPAHCNKSCRTTCDWHPTDVKDVTSVFDVSSKHRIQKCCGRQNIFSQIRRKSLLPTWFEQVTSRRTVLSTNEAAGCFSLALFQLSYESRSLKARKRESHFIVPAKALHLTVFSSRIPILSVAFFLWLAGCGSSHVVLSELRKCSYSTAFFYLG